MPSYKLLALTLLVPLLAIFSYNLCPTHVLVAVIDKTFWFLTYLDGVEEYNYRKPNYIDGNWRPVVETLKNVNVKVEGRKMLFLNLIIIY